MATQSTNIALRQSKYTYIYNNEKSLFTSCGSVHLFVFGFVWFAVSVCVCYVSFRSILITMEYFLHDQSNWMYALFVRVWDDIDRCYMQFVDFYLASASQLKQQRKKPKF